MGKGGMTYVVLQVHYNNLMLDSPIDNSGFRIHYTRKLPMYNIGVLVLGWEFFSIPKKTKGWTQGDSVCPSSCTNKFNGPVHVIKDFLHMHRLGAQMITRHARLDEETGEWNELRPFGSLSYYDFNFQSTGKETPLDASTILPGDALVTRCTWDNPGPKAVNFGQATANEMCYSYIHYYPLENLNGISQCTNIGMGFHDALGLTTCYDANALDFHSLVSAASKAAKGGGIQTAVNVILSQPHAFVQAESYIPTIWNPFVPTLPPQCNTMATP
jgi:hypothetical protein